MDQYAYILEQLRCDDFKRLRSYAADERSEFTTWLVVVARRLCLDYRRRRYGRPRAASAGAALEHVVRKRLVDFVAEDIDRSGYLSSDGADPEMELRAAQLRDALREALDGLPTRDRLLLALRYEEELTAREITHLMGFASVFHVYRRLTSVQRSLRAQLEGRGVDGALP